MVEAGVAVATMNSAAATWLKASHAAYRKHIEEHILIWIMEQRLYAAKNTSLGKLLYDEKDE